MKNEIEKRLHRVMIKLDQHDIKCPNSRSCVYSENCTRCNIFFQKCSFYADFDWK